MNNENISYYLSLLWRSWFWLGIWIFYYLRFTDYAGIGFLETVMIATSSLGEIPTGAIADVVGKRVAVLAAFTLGALGNIVMAISPSYTWLIVSIILMTLGGAFYSGSLEALVYDSLKENGQESRFQKVLGRMTTMQNVGMAFAAILGGYLYQINVSLPFFGVAGAYMIGAVLATRLTEPRVDTVKYSWQKFIAQNIEGFKQLFGSSRVRNISIILLIPSMFMVATENVLNDATAVELGFSSVELGILATILYFGGILAAESSDKIIKWLGRMILYIVIVMIYSATLLLIPTVGITVGGLLLLIRYVVQTLYGNLESGKLNEIIDSKYRATTLSTYSLMRNIPYMIGATGIGLMMSRYTAKEFSLYFGVGFFITVLLTNASVWAMSHLNAVGARESRG